MKNKTETKRSTILKLIEFLNGKFFTVEFTKKDGTIRLMNCRTGVKKHLKPGAKKINIKPAFYTGVIRVFDLQKKAYRSINIDTVKKINFNKISYKF